MEMSVPFLRFIKNSNVNQEFSGLLNMILFLTTNVQLVELQIYKFLFYLLRLKLWIQKQKTVQH